MKQVNISRKSLEQVAAQAAQVARQCGFGLSLDGRTAQSVTGMAVAFPPPNLLPVFDWRDPKNLEMLPGFGVSVVSVP